MRKLKTPSRIALPIGFTSLLMLTTAVVGFAQETMFITGDRVGIGTDTPNSILHLNSATNTGNNLWFSAPHIGYIMEETDAADDQRMVQLRMNNGRFQIRGLDANLAQNVPGITLLLGDTGGDVGIGTLYPSSRLHVSGGDIRVSDGSFIDDGTTLNVPDYVFAPDYMLPNLDQVAAFIARERHLPGVPSAADIKENGLNLTQFQMKLLEKIEELTLYTLAQEEKIDRLERLLEGSVQPSRHDDRQ